ncbi:MAG TPA: hypothetical protein VF155_10455 [Candidatus Dormibacteraeota bacterium]
MKGRLRRVMRDRAAPAVLAAFVPFGAVACGAAYPGEPATANVTMVDYHFSAPATVAVGRVVFDVVNHGQHPHELVLVPLPADFPPLNQQLHSNTRRALPTVAVLPQLPPGGSGTLAVDLAAGRYGIISFVEGSDGSVDALRGMNAEIRAQ